MNILLINNGVVTAQGMSGSDHRAMHWGRIFGREHRVEVLTPAFASRRYPEAHRLHTTEHEEHPAGFLNYLGRARRGRALVRGLDPAAYDMVYSTSDLIPDTVPAYALKRREPRIRWLSGLHLVAPKPWRGFDDPEGKQFRLPTAKGIYYYLSQSLTLRRLKRHASLILVSNEYDKQRLVRKGLDENRMLVTHGCPDWDTIRQVGPREILYDACCIARYHPQKGYDALVRAWARVTRERPEARLALIGDIPEETLQTMLRGQGVAPESVVLHGPLVDRRKYEILFASKMLLFPSSYESFGMVATEAQAGGVPVVAFDLPHYPAIFPQGMVRVPMGDVEAFAQTVLRLLDDPEERERLSREAAENAKRFDFNLTARAILDRLEE